jgi:hypothetical protein
VQGGLYLGYDCAISQNAQNPDCIRVEAAEDPQTNDPEHTANGNKDKPTNDWGYSLLWQDKDVVIKRTD